MTLIIFIIIQCLAVPVLSPLCIGIVRKIKAKLQMRAGASIFQPYKDLWKLFHKDEVMSVDASSIFRCAPYVVFAMTAIVGANIPILSSVFVGNPMGDILVIVYLLATATFFLALAAVDTGSAFGGLGGSREMTFAALAEGALLFSLLVVAFVTKSSNLFVMSGTLSDLPFIFFAPVALAFFSFFIVMLAESGRFPFDNPATHLELTMIHEAMILEYSGKRLALMEWAAANKFFIFLTIGANVFFPWGLASSLQGGAIAVAILIYLGKLCVLTASVALLESTMAKFRFFRLPDLLFTSFVVSIIALSFVLFISV